jgi:CRP/FNR family transcriptional regulator, cyclic AMP receptor protein
VTGAVRSNKPVVRKKALLPVLPSKALLNFNPEKFLQEAGVGRSVRKAKKRTRIFSQGEPGDAVYFIQEGIVKLSVISTQGKEATVSLFHPGSFIGEECVVGSVTSRLATATAMTDTVLMRIDRKEMIRVIHEESAFSEVFVAYLLLRNATIQADLVDQLFNSSEKRLARTLLQLANFGKAGKPSEEIPKISQQVLSEMIGCTRSRVSFFMNRFRRLGFIEYNGSFRIHSSLLNVILHD